MGTELFTPDAVYKKIGEPVVIRPNGNGHWYRSPIFWILLVAIGMHAVFTQISLWNLRIDIVQQVRLAKEAQDQQIQDLKEGLEVARQERQKLQDKIDRLNAQAIQR